MKILIFLIFIFLSPLQEINGKDILKGTIRDKNKMPIPGAVVSIKKDNRIIAGTYSNVDGQYELAVPDSIEKFILIYSFIGMKTKEIKIDRTKDKSRKNDADWIEKNVFCFKFSYQKY